MQFRCALSIILLEIGANICNYNVQDSLLPLLILSGFALHICSTVTECIHSLDYFVTFLIIIVTKYSFLPPGRCLVLKYTFI